MNQQQPRHMQHQLIPINQHSEHHPIRISPPSGPPQMSSGAPPPPPPTEPSHIGPGTINAPPPPIHLQAGSGIMTDRPPPPHLHPIQQPSPPAIHRLQNRNLRGITAAYLPESMPPHGIEHRKMLPYHHEDLRTLKYQKARRRESRDSSPRSSSTSSHLTNSEDSMSCLSNLSSDHVQVHNVEDGYSCLPPPATHSVLQHSHQRLSAPPPSLLPASTSPTTHLTRHDGTTSAETRRPWHENSQRFCTRRETRTGLRSGTW